MFESISGCSRLDRASPIEAFRSDEGRILRILRHEIHVVIGQVSAKGAGTLWRGETWRRNGRSWLRYAEFPIFTPSSFLERVLHVRKDFDEPDGFLSSPLPHPPSRDSHFSWRKNSKMGIDKFSTLYGTIDILIYSMTFFLIEIEKCTAFWWISCVENKDKWIIFFIVI